LGEAREKKVLVHTCSVTLLDLSNWEKRGKKEKKIIIIVCGEAREKNNQNHLNKQEHDWEKQEEKI
jgi:hypothetical protein